MLQVCDFLRCLGAPLSLPRYSVHELLDELASPRAAEPPPRLAELLHGLLHIVLSDRHADVWWPNPAVLAVTPPSANRSHKKGASSGDEKKKRQWWEKDFKPICRCDLAAVLGSSEPPSTTRRWVAVLETVAPMRTNTGVPIRSAIELAARTAREPELLCRDRLTMGRNSTAGFKLRPRTMQ